MNRHFPVKTAFSLVLQKVKGFSQTADGVGIPFLKNKKRFRTLKNI
jgi:hypothetical protein